VGKEKNRVLSLQSAFSIQLAFFKSLRIRTAEPQNKEPQNIEVKKLSKTSAVSAGGGFDIRYSKYQWG
jgi:hypothetical protein